ncbi:MAG: type II toxin-antitoxin system HicA family toxin [Dehalococcoidia bacterium]|nr:type II toxin-antitoxin system HicA family toxin [Dehalococcoidia bacterium]
MASGTDTWWRPGTGYRTRVPRHNGEVPNGTLRSMLQELGWTMDGRPESRVTGRCPIGTPRAPLRQLDLALDDLNAA